MEILFQLLKSKRCTIPFIEVVTCTQHAIEFGCSFSHLASDLINYLPNLESLLEKNEDSRKKLELLKVAYHCCFNIAVDHRLEVCRFTEKISKHIHSVFTVDLNEESKEKLFRLMDLALIVHYPMLETEREKLKFVEDVALWNSQLRNYVYIVELELKLQSKVKHRGVVKQDMNQVLVQFAARLCYLLYWDDFAWREAKDEESNQSKRLRRSTSLQAMIELAQPTPEAEFNWKWLVVIAEIIYNFQSSLHLEEYQILLQTIAQCQGSMDSEFQIYAFTKICSVLLDNEQQFLTNANAIVANSCKELWHKIASAALRMCTSNVKNSTKNHILLQILIKHHKQPSNSFIEDVIKIFLADSSIKCDATLQTLVTVMSSFNLDTIHNGKELLEKLLEYNFEKASLSNLRKVIATTGKDKPTVYTLAKVGAMCCLSQTDLVKFFANVQLDLPEIFAANWNLEVQNMYKNKISEIIHHIMLKHNEKLLIEDEDFLKVQPSPNKKEENIPIEIKCIIDQNAYEQLQKVTSFTTKIIDGGKDLETIKDYLLLVMQNNELMMCLADNFLKLEAFNEERFKSSFIIKKIDYHLQEINRLFKLILDKKTNLELYATSDLISLVVSMLSNKYHQAICQKVRSIDLSECLNWLSHQAERTFATPDDDEKEPMPFGLEEFLNAALDEKMKFVAVAALCEYNNFPGVNSDLFYELLTEIEFDLFNNMDLHCIFHVIKTLAGQPQKDEDTVNWIWSYIGQICKYHNGNQYLSGRLITSLEHVLTLSKGFAKQTGNLIAIYGSFAKICSKPQYDPSVTVNFLHQMKVFHQVRS